MCENEGLKRIEITLILRNNKIYNNYCCPQRMKDLTELCASWSIKSVKDSHWRAIHSGMYLECKQLSYPARVARAAVPNNMCHANGFGFNWVTFGKRRQTIVVTADSFFISRMPVNSNIVNWIAQCHLASVKDEIRYNI